MTIDDKWEDCCAEGDYDDDDFGEDDGAGCMPDDREEPPMYGCACQNPLVADAVCFGCTMEMARQNAEADRERAAASQRELRRLEATTQPHGDALGEREKLLTAKTVRHLKHIANEPGVKGTWCGADRDMWRDTWNRKSATCKECLAAIALASKPQAPGDGNG